MQGIFINGMRPKFKKDVKTYIDGVNLWQEHGGDPEAISALRSEGVLIENGVRPEDPYGLVIEATSLFGNEFDGSLAQAIREDREGPYYIVGPDPHTNRKWYLTITYNRNKHEWEVK